MGHEWLVFAWWLNMMTFDKASVCVYLRVFVCDCRDQSFSGTDSNCEHLGLNFTPSTSRDFFLHRGERC